MRQKVYIIRGQQKLSEEITMADFQRINVDELLNIILIRDKHMLDTSEDYSHLKTQSEIFNFIGDLTKENALNILASEYAEALLNRGWSNVKAVEGWSLLESSTYEMVRAIHKNYNQLVVEVTVARPEGHFVLIEGKKFSWEEAVNLLCRDPSLG